MPFRLPPDQMRRLEKVAHSLKKTKQSFVQEIVLERVSELEEHRRIERRPQIGNSPLTSNDDGNSGGLGLAAALHKAKEQSVERIASTAPVVVNVGNNGNSAVTSSSALSELDRLALYVIKGDDFLRDARKRSAIEILRASAGTDEEFNVLVAQLEQTVAVKNKTVEESSGVNKLARFAFDKLTTLLRGD